MGSHIALVKGNRQMGFRLTELYTGFWFWLEGIAERNLSLAQPYTIPWLWLKGIGKGISV